MVKKVLMLVFGVVVTSCLMAQSAPKSVTINQSDIQFWTGTGSNSTVVAIGWDDDDASYVPTVVVWGVRWNGTITLLNALDTIMAYDSRFSYTLSGSFLNGVSYTDASAGVALTPSAGWNCNNYNGVYGSTNLGTTWLRISESTCDNFNFTGVNNLIYASNPSGSGTLPDTVDASLPFSEILYWVGSGSDSAEFIVNFANPDTAFAWGYLFNGSTTAQAMIDAIAAADPRFWVEGTPSYNGDIHFVTDNGDTLGLSPIDPTVGYNFWWTNLNGVSAGSGTASTLHNGDVFKFGDLNSATGWDAMGTYYLEEAWNTIPTPVTVPGSTPSVVEATIAASDILYWVGEGANQVVMAVNWPDTALAWGYRFDGTKTVGDMMNDIAAADPRFSYTMNGTYLGDITFNEGTVSLSGTSWWGSSNNGVMDMGMSQPLSDGDFEKWYDGSTGVWIDSVWVDDWGGYWSQIYVYPMTIHPVSVPVPVPEEATFAASAIEYWVGEGANEAVMAVNWADTALAWGYRWNGTKTVGDMMDDIAAADPRFSYTMSGTYLGDITFNEGTVSLSGTSWWGSSNNGVMDMGMSQPLNDGDFEKWYDGSTGVWIDSVWVEDWGGYWSQIYVYPMEIFAASQPVGYGPFTGIVGTDGCEAIAANDTAIVAWATACTVVRGSQNLTNPEAPVVTYGAESDAVGAATTSTMDVVSLGDGGSATVTFAHPITNGEGPDFAVFENSFDDYFLELAFVEVSSDGERFVRFPATSLTQTARQIVSRVDATYINNLAGKYRVGYGTPFDLAELADSTGLDINNITHVRIVDVIGSIDPQYATYDAYGHMVNDPFPTVSYSAGFDLDGVAVLHQSGVGVDDVTDIEVSVYPNPVSDRLTVSGAAGNEAVLYDMTGRQLASWTIATDQQQLNTAALAQGIYLLRIGDKSFRVAKR